MRFLVFISIPFLAGCAAWKVQKPLESHDMAPPAGWQAASDGHHGEISTGWLKTFRQPQLETLVHQAIEHNHSLQVAAANMRQARQGAIISRAQRLPSLDLSSGASISDIANDAGREDYRLSLSASWEIDLWGRLRDLDQAGNAFYRAAVHDYRNARLSLAANTAKAWCNLISANQLVTLAKATLQSFEKNLRIIERNYKGTGEGALDIQFGRNNVSSAERTLEARRLQRDEAARALEILLGHYPDASITAGHQLPRIPEHAPAGLPAELLDRRPDIRAARERLLARAREADAARKALLPGVAITASSGTTSSNFNNLLDLDNLVHSLTARLTQSITRGGALTAAARAAVERNRAEIHRYAQIVLNAWREVESTLAADRSLAKQEAFLDAELKQAILAENQAERDYTEGINPNILSVLEAQRRANNARGSMILLRNRRIQNRIDMHLALGGDFSTITP